MHIGQTFNSFPCLESAIKQYEFENFSKLVKLKSRTIEGARKKGLKRFINENLQYVEIDYRCIRSNIPKSKGTQAKQSSNHGGCPVFLKVRVNESGNNLIITFFETRHNHGPSQVLNIGDTFESFQQFQSKLREYEKNVCNNYCVQDSVTLQQYSRKYPQEIARRASPKLKYYSVRVCCIKGGRGCQAGLYLQMTKCGKYLEIIEINEQHDHETFFDACIEASGEISHNENTETVLKLSNSKTIPDIDIQKHEKFKMISDQCYRLSDLCCDISFEVFQERLQFVRHLADEWSHAREEKLSDLNVDETDQDENNSSRIQKKENTNDPLDIKETPLSITSNIELCEIEEESEDSEVIIITPDI